jgi:hypothetical protein
MSDPYRGRGGGGRARLGGGGRGFVEGNRYNVLREDSGEQNTSTPRTVVNTRQGERQKRTLDERSPGSHGQVERNPRQRRNGEQEERGRGGGEAPTDEQSRFMVIDETGGDL